MNRNSKKGFTIVELIIVIAVIAVLAAVLIPTFSNLIQKANEAKDTALVSNLNKGLKMSSKDFATMHEALQAVEENVGVDVEKISAVATDSKILWDSVNNCFVYLKSGDTKPTYIPDSQKTTVADNEQYKYWQIVDTAVNDAIYSQYLAGDNHTEAVTVNTGFDAGKNANLVSVTYTNTESQSVVIRTNGGELVVDAGNATVAHYGKAASVKIEAVAPNSYHEFGKVVGDIEIKKGRIELAATAEVTTVLVSSAAENAVKVDVVSGAQVGTVAPTTDSAKKDVEASTSIPTESKQTEVVTVNEDFAGGLGTERSPYLIATAEQFKNIKSGRSISNKLYYNLINNIEFKEVDGAQGVENNWTTAYHPETVQYIVLNGQQKKIVCEGEPKVFDFVRYSKITNIELTSTSPFMIQAQGTTLSNVNVYGEMEFAGGNMGAFMIFAAGNGLVFENCNNYATINGSGDSLSYNAVFVGYAYVRNQTITFINSHNYGTLVTGRASMFVGNLTAPTNLVIENCENKGEIRATYMGEDYIQNCFVSVSTNNLSTIKYNNKLVGLDTIISGGFYRGPNDTMTLEKNSDNTLKFTKSNNANVAYYIVSIGLYVNWASEEQEGQTSRFYVEQRISVTNADVYNSELKVLSFVDKAWVQSNNSAVEGELAGNKTYTLNSMQYYMVTEDRCDTAGKPKAAQVITVSAYLADGTLVSSVSM